jgi:uncharacterized alkaline shock family protein YloU
MNVGRIVVATPVAEKIAALTALATPGVIRLEPSISALAASFGRRALSGWHAGGDGAMPATAGVRVEITGDEVTVEIALAVALGWAIPDVAADAQRRVAEALGELGGFTVASVTILVVDVG